MKRPYRLGQREASVEQTRARIIAAARDLLASPGLLPTDFTVDAVAARADVARMTLYNQFGSKRGLLEALFDDLGARGLIGPLRAAFMRCEPHEALAEFVAAFGGFWNSERIAIRRIRALASIDPDFEQAVRERDQRRRDGLSGLVDRLIEKDSRPSPAARDDVIALLHTLTSFETFDSLADSQREPARVTALIRRLAEAAIDLGQTNAGGWPS
jgi:AcrR family transcriptional regulator